MQKPGYAERLADHQRSLERVFDRMIHLLTGEEGSPLEVLSSLDTRDFLHYKGCFAVPLWDNSTRSELCSHALASTDSWIRYLAETGASNFQIHFKDVITLEENVSELEKITRELWATKYARPFSAERARHVVNSVRSMTIRH